MVQLAQQAIGLFLGHAVQTPQVTTIGEAESQIGNSTGKGVAQGVVSLGCTGGGAGNLFVHGVCCWLTHIHVQQAVTGLVPVCTTIYNAVILRLAAALTRKARKAYAHPGH